MDRSGLLLAFAVAFLYIANASFSELAYFRPMRLVLLNILGLISAILFFLAYSQRGKKLGIGKGIKLNKYLLVALVLFFFLIMFQMAWIAVLVSLAALAAIAWSSRRLKGTAFYSVVIVIIVLASAFSYVSVSGLRGTHWKGVDEVAYNYYAPYLLLHGVNPYSVSMRPIIVEHNITPTYLMNGTVETAYDYPAFSFIPVLFLGFFDLKGFLVFISAVALITTISAFLVYRNSKYNVLVLVPLSAWLLVTYMFLGTIDHYIAVAIFLVIAYIYRRNTVISGIALGISASTIQLSWFAAPFFLILMLRERGKRAALYYAVIAIAVFFVINSYFIAIGPMHFFSNIFGLLGRSNLLLVGTDIMQVLVRSYGVPLWYPEAISMAFLLVSLLLFYLYTNTLKQFLALVPAFIFMLSWHNFLMYSLAYVPLLIILCYEDGKPTVKDIPRRKVYITMAFTVTILFSVLLAIYAHHIYASNNTIAINGIALNTHMIQGANTYEINSITVNVTNNVGHYENVSVFVLNRYPMKDGIFIASNLSGVPPHSTMSYTFNYNVSNVSKNTSIYIMAFSKDYITNREFSINWNQYAEYPKID